MAVSFMFFMYTKCILDYAFLIFSYSLLISRFVIPRNMYYYFRTCEFPSDLKMDNVTNCKKSDSHGSLAESKCSCLILPQWILDHSDMIFPPNSIKRMAILGSGQFGTVYKGTYCQGNAV